MALLYQLFHKIMFTSIKGFCMQKLFASGNKMRSLTILKVTCDDLSTHEYFLKCICILIYSNAYKYTQIYKHARANTH